MLSPLLFNCALEHVIRQWKKRLSSHGIKLENSESERLTNVRFADVLIIYANSLGELVDMLRLHLSAQALESVLPTGRAGTFFCV